MGIFGFSYRKTSYYLIQGSGDGLVAFDAGWPCTFNEYARALKSTGMGIQQVKWAMVSHFHMDHAGLVGEMIRRGISCIAFEKQLDGIDEMERLILRQAKDYAVIDKSRLLPMKSMEARAWFLKLGIGGAIVETPGHSPDSVSFVSDAGEALTGDLPAEALIMDNDVAGKLSWQRLRSRRAKAIYPAHGKAYTLSDHE
jgi:glyoxylase-like metal-dependent hydrolase (beta-lactamase superfamily II)